MAPQSAGDPCGQCGEGDFIRADDGAVLFQRSEPFALEGSTFELGQRDECERIGVEVLAMVLQCLRAFHAGFAGRDAQVDHLARREQRHALRAVAQFAPFEILLRDEGLALGVSRFARGIADGVGSFDGK